MSWSSGVPTSWFLPGDVTLNQPWTSVSGNDGALNNHWTITTPPVVMPGSVGYVSMGGNSAWNLARDADWLTLSEASYVGGAFTDVWRMHVSGVEYMDAAPGETIDLEIVGKRGFTTDGSFRSISMNVGHHTMAYTVAARDSTLFTGVGWDTVQLIDYPDQSGEQYWSVIRRADGQFDAYSLYSGFRVRMEGGGQTWGNSNGTRNYGEVDRIEVQDGRLGTLDVWGPGEGLSGFDERGGFTNIDLASDDLYNGNPHRGAAPAPDGFVDPYSDSFNFAYFNYIRYTSNNLWAGASTIHDGGQRYSAAFAQMVNGTHDLPVAEQTSELDGRLRLYVRDVQSGLYNEFNRVYLGGPGADDHTITSTSTPAGRAALYGFGGNDTLAGGAGKDYLFGGAGSYSLLPGAEAPGNWLTGGAGADFFGVGNMNAAGALVGSGADVVQDWHAGVDSLRVLSNGIAVIGGLYGVNGLGGNDVLDLRAVPAWSAPGVVNAFATMDSDQQTFPLGGKDTLNVQNVDYTVFNEGLVVMRGLAGTDTLHGSPGNDYIYGNSADNLVSIGNGGRDSVFYDVFSGRQFVTGFSTNATDSAGRDRIWLSKNVIDAFGGNSARPLTAENSTGAYSVAIGYDPNINFMHDIFYDPAGYPASSSAHVASDGSWNQFGTADGNTFAIGVGLVAAGYILNAITFGVGGIALIATGTAVGGLGATGVIPTQPHINAKYNGPVSNYLTVLDNTRQPGVDGDVASASDLNPDTYRFLDFFVGTDAGDGYLPVLEFTHPSASGGVYGYFSVYSGRETFVYVVASSDNIVENSETFRVAEINGDLAAEDFIVYDPAVDIYNRATNAAIVLRNPSVTEVRDSDGTLIAGSTTTSATTSDIATITLNGGFSGTTSAGSTLRLFDRTVQIGGPYDVGGASNFSGVVDTRGVGTVLRQGDNLSRDADNTFLLTDTVASYRIELTDGATGIITRSGNYRITLSGGNATLDGGGGSDMLALSGTSQFLNALTDARLVNMEDISLSSASGVHLDLSSQSEAFRIITGEGADTVVGGAGNDSFVSFTGDDSIDGGGGSDNRLLLSSTSSDLNLASDNELRNIKTVDVTAASTGVSVLLGTQSDGFVVLASGSADTLTGSTGGDTITGGGGADTIDLGVGAADMIVMSFTDGASPGSATGYDSVTRFDAGGTDKIWLNGLGDRDGASARLMYDSAALGANKELSAQTELLVVSNSAVAAGAGLVGGVRDALKSAFNLTNLSDGSVAFVVKGSDAGVYWVGRYVDGGQDDEILGSDITVLAQVTASGGALSQDSFWIPAYYAPQAVALSLTADTGVTSSDWITSNPEMTVTGLSAGNRLYWSADAGVSWTTGNVDDATFDLAVNTTYAPGDIRVRQVDSNGNYSAVNGAGLGYATANTSSIIIDTLAPTEASAGLSNGAGDVGRTADLIWRFADSIGVTSITAVSVTSEFWFEYDSVWRPEHGAQLAWASGFRYVEVDSVAEELVIDPRWGRLADTSTGDDHRVRVEAIVRDAAGNTYSYDSGWIYYDVAGTILDTGPDYVFPSFRDVAPNWWSAVDLNNYIDGSIWA